MLSSIQDFFLNFTFDKGLKHDLQIKKGLLIFGGREGEGREEERKKKKQFYKLAFNKWQPHMKRLIRGKI